MLDDGLKEYFYDPGSNIYHLNMAIYTKTGDNGTTGLYGGKRISKASCQVESYGSIDELTTFIGMTVTKIADKKNKQLLTDIQRDLYEIMSYLSGAKINLSFLDKKTTTFEKNIDEIEKKLPTLTKFILPGGSEQSSWLHISRVKCRRAERIIIDYFNKKDVTEDEFKIIKYLNRLSDLFFDLARLYNKGEDVIV